MMAEMEALVKRTMAHQQEQLGANMALVSNSVYIYVYICMYVS